MDTQVLAAQQLVNSYIDRGVLQEPVGYRVDENGMTGWPVVYGLIRILQYELGIAVLADAPDFHRCACVVNVLACQGLAVGGFGALTGG